MSPQPPSRGSTHGEPRGIFRETFLCLRLPRSLARAARVLGLLLHREAERLPPEPEGVESVQRVLLATAWDLRYLESFLLVQARDSSLPPRAMSRVLVAQRVAESLGRLAETLEGASR